MLIVGKESSARSTLRGIANCVKNGTRKIAVCNFQSMKSSVKLNSLYQNSFVISPGSLYHLIRRDPGRLANEAFTSNPIVSLKQ